MATAVDNCVGCEDTTDVTCDDFSVCIGNKTLSFSDCSLTLAENAAVNIPDGTYNQLTFQDGCLVAVDNSTLSVYTPDDCCGETTATPTGNISLLNSANNLLQQVGDDYYVTPVFQNSTDISMSGSGTTADPWIPTFTGSTGAIKTFATGGCLTVTDTNDLVTISHPDNGLAAGVYNGITVDECGHISAIDIDNTVNSVTSEIGSAIVVTPNGDDYELSIQPSAAAGTYNLESLLIVVDDEGRVTQLTASPTLAAGTFTTNDGRTVTFNAYGLITNIA